MSFRNVEKKLYGRNEGDEKKSVESFWKQDSEKTAEENPFRPEDLLPAKGDKSAIWIKEDEEKKKKRKKLKKIFLAAVLAVAGLVVLYWAVGLVRKGIFSGDRVKVTVSSPEKVQSGDLATFVIDYQNLNSVSLREAVVHINFPENFKPEENLNFESEGPNVEKYVIGNVPGKTGGKISFQGKFFGPKDLLTYINVLLEYKSFNFSSTFTTEAKTGVFIASSPLFLEISGPREAAPGNVVNYSVKYKNNGESVFRNLKMKVDYPADFSYAVSEPLPTKDNNVWYVGDLGAGESGEVKISGNINGRNDEIKRFKASLGEYRENEEFFAYADSESSLKVVGSSFEIEQTVNGGKDAVIVNAGETLQFNIKFRNASSIGLKDVILTEELKSSILDYTRLSISNSKAHVDFSKGVLTWKAFENPVLKALNPGQGGEVSFSVPVKEIIPVAGSNDKNFSVSAVAKIDSPDVPTPEGANKTVASNAVNIRLNSKLGIAAEGYYNDSEIQNSGPTPLVSGTETTFAIHLKLLNVSNDLTNVKVVGSLPAGVSWKGVFVPKDANVSFNGRTNEFSWEIGKLPAGIGVLTDPRELIFQIGVTPEQNLIGGYAPLLGRTVFSGQDSFTGQGPEASFEGKDSNLPEDISIGGSGGKVAQ
ncbi:MAG: hypothetical protein COZ87_03665 [Candidatus Moranbacteria bacterium CG_4_8_14_3_um_filter_43_15]|nr:MAG: hypothetical protein COZ87_03665 [Candidatus Moranbacteria bacterium CG_4_8_14_3_um_filter_43_15]